MDNFLTELHVRIRNCNFPITLYKDVRDHVVVGIKDKALSEKLQLNSQLTLEKAVTVARQSEAVKKQQETFPSVSVFADRVITYEKKAVNKPSNR